mmetsp:Transcript_39008/g.76256  ORF Transcript_39008/g.76256 Transcript_39008/m.76256 type:complete len:363 (+) Transcript_39008:1238-2326(+)
MLGARGVGGEEGKVDLGRGGGRELALRLLRSLAQALDHKPVLADIHARVLLEGLHEVVEDRSVEVLTTQVSVAVGGLDLKDTTVHLKDRHIERATAEIVHRDGLAVLLLVHTIGQSSSSGLVDDAKHLEARDPASILGRLALRVVEVSGHRHHGLLHGPAEVAIGRLLHLLEHVGADLRGGVGLAGLVGDPGVAVGGLDDLEGGGLDVLLEDGVVVRAPDETLGREEGILRVRHRLALGGGADKHGAVLLEGDDGRGGAGALAVLDDLGLHLPLHDGDTRVGGAEVNPNHIPGPRSRRHLSLEDRRCTAQGLGLGVGRGGHCGPLESLQEHCDSVDFSKICLYLVPCTAGDAARPGAFEGSG